MLDAKLLDTIVHLTEAAVIALLAVVGLQIKNAQTQSKLELSDKLHEVKLDFAQKHAENQRSLAVHTAEDMQRFDSIGKTLERIDRKLDRRAT